MTLSVDKIIAFMNDKVTEPCPRCSSRTWGVSSVPSTLAGMWLADEQGNFSLDAGIAKMVLVYCKNCGFAAPHIQQVIEAWSEEKDRENG